MNYAAHSAKTATKDYIFIHSLRVEYGSNNNKVTALDSVNLSLEKGKTGVIIGPSGCGKSTLLSVLAGLNNSYYGQALIEGMPPARFSRSALILQDYGLLPWKTVWDNITLGLKIKKSPSNHIREKTKNIMEKLNITYLANRYPAQLSGGQRQRVAISRALVLEPELLLMDEPFSSLDALTREEMQDLLLDIWRETHCTILLITHNIEEAVFLGQKIYIMNSSPGNIKKEINNPITSTSSLREQTEFFNMCSLLRTTLHKR